MHRRVCSGRWAVGSMQGYRYEMCDAYSQEYLQGSVFFHEDSLHYRRNGGSHEGKKLPGIDRLAEGNGFS